MLILNLMSAGQQDRGMLTIVFHHLFFQQHSVSVWEEGKLIVEVLPYSILIYDFSCSNVFIRCINEVQHFKHTDVKV